MHTRLYLVTFGIAMALIAAGCNKSSSTAPQTQTNTAPTFPSVTVAGPTTTSTDSHAQLAISAAATVNAYANSGLFSAFSGQQGVQNGNTWTWTITEGTESVTFTQTKQADGSYTWAWVVNGTDPNTHVVYNNWTFFSGNRSADGKNGEWKVFNDNTTTLAADFTWTTNASGTLTGTVIAYNTSGVMTGKYIVINNSDKSGEVDIYSGTVLTFKATWVAAGSGTWWTYDSGTGTQTGTGTWS